MELALVRLSDNSLVLVDSFTEQEPEGGNSVASAIVALNRATGRLFDHFVQKATSVALPMAAKSLPPGSTTKTGIRR